MEIILRREWNLAELRSQRSGEGAGGKKEEHPHNDGDVSEPYIIIVMGQL